SGAGFDLTLSGSGNGVLSSALGTVGGGLIKTGTGTWTVSGANTNTGATTVNGGTLIVDLGTNTTGVLGSGTNLAINGSTGVVNGAPSGTSTQTLGSLSLGIGVNAVIALNPNGGTSTPLNLGTTWTRNSFASLLIDYTAANGSSRIVTTAAPSGSSNNV